MKDSVEALSEQFVQASIAYLQANLEGNEASILAANLVFCDKYRLLRNEGHAGVVALIELTTHSRIEVRVMAASVLYIVAPILAGGTLKAESAMVDTLEPGTLEFLAAERARVTFRLYEAGLKDIAHEIRESRRNKQTLRHMPSSYRQPTCQPA